MGKARKFSSNDDEAVLQSQSDSENYAIGAQQNAQNLGSVHFSDNSGYGNFIQAGRDQRNAALDGALFRGNIGFNLQICELDVGTETIDILDDGTTPLSVVSTDKIVSLSAGTTGDLTIILGAQRPGQRLLLYGIQGNTITIKNTAGAVENTILTPDGADFTLENTNVALLVYDITTTKWRVLSGGGSGGSTTVNAIKDPARVMTQFNYVDLSLVGNNIDDVICVVGDRILVNNQVTQSENGIYEVTGESPPGVLQLTRATDFDEDSEVIGGVLVYVNEGTNNGDQLFGLTTNDPITVGVTALTFVQIGGSGLQDPIILNENDLGTIGFINQLIDWSTNNFYRAVVNGDVVITMENLPATGKWEQVVLEITQDVVGGHPVTFSDTFANAVVPNINTGANSKTVITFYAYNDGVNDIILAFDTQSNFNAYPEVDLGTLGPAVVNIDWSLGNFQRMVLSGDVTITHTNLPLPLQWQQVIVEYTQDLVGNHNTTYTQSFGNGVVPLVNLNPTAKTSVVFYAYNTGVITIILAFETMSGGNTNFLHASKVANQAPPLTVGTTATFDSILSNSGLTVAAGIVSGFRAGRIYECECSIAILNAVSPAANISFQWNDIANATLIGTRGDCILTTQLAVDSGQPVAKAVFSPLLDTDTLEVQFTFNNDLVNTFMYGMGIAGTPASYIMIKDIT